MEIRNLKIQDSKDFDVLRRPDWSIDFKSKEKVRFNKIPSFVTPVEWGFNLRDRLIEF